jgi:hypothetical protein
MIRPEDELPKDGPEARQDAVTMELCDLARGVCALLRIVREAGEPAPFALGFAGFGDETAVSLGEPAGVRVEVEEPLRRWTCRFERDTVTLEAELEAVSPPVDFAEPAAGAVVQAAGVRRYEQICRARGEIRVEGRQTEIDGVGRRAHAWGEPGAARLRSLYAVAGDRAVTVTAVRPRGVEQHGAEQIGAYLVRSQEQPEIFEDTRLSTIYDAAGRPRKAGLELFLPGDEYPRRVSGEAICQATGARDHIEAACFRWSLDGDPAQGGYHVISAT